MLHLSELINFKILYEKWLDNNDINKWSRSPMLVLKFIYINGLLDENKFHEFIKRESK